MENALANSPLAILSGLFFYGCKVLQSLRFGRDLAHFGVRHSALSTLPAAHWPRFTVVVKARHRVNLFNESDWDERMGFTRRGARSCDEAWPPRQDVLAGFVSGGGRRLALAAGVAALLTSAPAAAQTLDD